MKGTMGTTSVCPGQAAKVDHYTVATELEY